MAPTHKKSPSPSPDRRKDDQAEIDAQLKAIRPRYPDFVSQDLRKSRLPTATGKASRPQSAMPVSLG